MIACEWRYYVESSAHKNKSVDAVTWRVHEVRNDK